MNALSLPGAHFRPAVFEPTFHKHAGTCCGGCQIHVTNRETFPPVETGVALLAAFRRTGPFLWRPPPYEYEPVKLPIDILAGSSELREQIERGMPAGEIADSWNGAVAGFRGVRERFLLY
jgi:uncharacterized protein YbbC (DUF1343 family)